MINKRLKCYIVDSLCENGFLKAISRRRRRLGREMLWEVNFSCFSRLKQDATFLLSVVLDTKVNI
jgi:hypothetical protein